jgi:hypothetical protein
MSAGVAASPARTPFYMIANAIIDEVRLNPYELSLYNALVRHVNYKTGVAYPSLKRLADLTQMARPTVVKYLKALEHKGLIRITRGFKKGTKERAVNCYQILAPSPYHDADPPSPSGEMDDVSEPPTDPVERGSSRFELPPVAAEAGSSRHEPQVVHDVNQGGLPDDLTVVNGANRNETVSNQTILKKMGLDERGPARSAGSRSPQSGAAPRRKPSLLSRNRAGENSEQWNRFCHALADVCRLDFEVNAGRIRKTASTLWRSGSGYTTEDLYCFGGWWYRNDWRGKKGEVPRLRDVVELIRAATATKESVLDRYLGARSEYAGIIQY